MYAQGFDYVRPSSLAEAAELLRTRPDARPLAGGHSLLPAMKLRVAGPPTLVDIGRLKELRGIQAVPAGLEIGALTTHGEIAASETVRSRCAVLADAAGQIGDLQVRNRGTIGGSLAHADPAADLPTVLLLLGGSVVATDGKAVREVAAGKFFTDLFTTDLKPGELLKAVKLPGYGAGTGVVYLKHRHPASSYAVVGVGALVELKDGKCARAAVAVGGATVNPVLAAAAAQALVGKAPDEAALGAAAARVAEAIQSPLSDVYASGEFRTHLAGVLAKRALARAAQLARG